MVGVIQRISHRPSGDRASSQAITQWRRSSGHINWPSKPVAGNFDLARRCGIEKALTSLHLVDPKIQTIIIDMYDVPSMDGSAIVAIQSLINDMHSEGAALILVGLPTRIIVKLRRAGIRKTSGMLTYRRDLERAKTVAMRWRRQRNKESLLDSHLK